MSWEKIKSGRKNIFKMYFKNRQTCINDNRQKVTDLGNTGHSPLLLLP